MNNKIKISLVSMALLAIIGFALYANSLHNEFVYDDELVIKNNVFITNLSNIKYLFAKEYYVGSGEYTYRPILTFTYMLDYHFWKFNPVGYHLTNIIFHVTAGILFYFFILLFLPMLSNKLPVYPTAFLSSLLFIIHPIQTEVVNSPAFRDDAVFAVFFFPTLIFYLKTKSAKGIKRILFYAFSFLFCFFSPFAKELGLGMIVFLALIDICLWRNNTDKLAPVILPKKLVIPYSLYLILAFFYIYIGLIKFTNTSILYKVHANFDLNYIVVMGSQYLVYYCKLLLFPFQLSVEYFFIQTKSIFDPKVIFSIAALIGLAAVVIRKFKTDRIFVFSVSWIFIFILPLMVFPYQPIAERFLYLPCAGFCFLLAVTIIRVFSLKPYKEIAGFLAILLIFAYSIRTITRNMVWRNPLVFWEERVKYPPATVRAHTNLGSVYQDLGRYEEAEEQLKASMEAMPSYADSHNNLGNVYYEKGLYDKAIEEFKTTLKLNPDLIKAYFNLGNTYLKLNRYNDAIEEYKIFLNRQPFNLEANNNLANAYYALGRYDEAIEYFKKALQIKSDFMESWYNLANTYMAKGAYEEAINTYKSLLEKYPDNYDARNNLATIYLAKERFNEAIVQLKKVIESNPKFVGAYYNLGNTYYKQGLNDAAIAEYEKALAIDPKFTGSYDNLGLIYFQMGMKDKAIELWEKALAIDPNDIKAQKNLQAVGKIQ